MRGMPNRVPYPATRTSANTRRIWVWCWLGVLGRVLVAVGTLQSIPAFASGPSSTRIWGALVVHVSDGDTLWVQPDHPGEALKLRLAGIDAPEICQFWGEQARQALQSRLQGQRVQLKLGRLDTYGRSLAQVWHQGQDVGGWMVANGHAWSPHYLGMPGPYEAWQRRAQWLRLGLFAHPLGLMPPREFRRWHGRC